MPVRPSSLGRPGRASSRQLQAKTGSVCLGVALSTINGVSFWSFIQVPMVCQSQRQAGLEGQAGKASQGGPGRQAW